MKRGRKNIGIDMALTDRDTTAFVRVLNGKKEVIFGGLGKFEIVRIRSKKLFHNTGKREITTKAYNKIKYTPSETLKEIVNRK